MALKYFDWSGSTQYQGGWGTTQAKAKANKKTLYLSFTIDNELKNLANNIRIDSAKLFLVCGSSGKGSLKDFTFSQGLTGTITSTGEARNNTCYLNLGDGYGLRAYLANGGGTISTYDDSSTYHSSSSPSGYYTENYCSVTAARLEIQYTVLQSTLVNYPTSITIGNNFTCNISASDSSYKHNLTLSIAGGGSISLLSNVAGGIRTCTTSTSWAQYFPNGASASAVMVLTTKDGSGNTLGTNSYSTKVNVTSSSGINPTVSVSSIVSNDEPYAFLNSSTITVKLAGEAKENASIKTYKLQIGDIQLTNTTGTFSFLPTTEGNLTFFATVTDSRGMTGNSTSLTKRITSYSAPSIQTGSNPFYRVDSEGNPTIQGEYYAFSYLEITKSDLYDFNTGEAIINEASASITINEVVSQITTNPWISTNTYKVDSSYIAVVQVVDTYGTIVSYTFDAPSASYLLHFLNKQNSVGIGCAAEELGEDTGRITLGWPVYSKQKATFLGEVNFSEAIPINSGGTGATSKEGAQTSLGIVDLIYPIGSIYMSMNSTNPSQLFPGSSWKRCGEGRVPIGVNTSATNFSEAGKTGGSATHTLTVNEMPSHNHRPANWTDDPAIETGGTFYNNFLTIRDIASDDAFRAEVAKSSSSNYNTAVTTSEYGVKDSQYTTSTGGGQAFDTLPPYFTCYMWERTS